MHLNNYKNCYIECPDYFYYDKNMELYLCTKNATCHNKNYSKLIYEKRNKSHNIWK